jgi:hypothetical protein
VSGNEYALDLAKRNAGNRRTEAALDLAKRNAGNRRTEAALDFLIVAGLAAGARDEACAAALPGATLRYATPAFRATVETTRRGCLNARAITGSP